MTRFQRALLVGSSVATAITGVGYGWMRYLMEPADPWAVVSHPLEPWFLKAHVLAAPVMVFAFGLIAVDHVWKHYRCRVPMGRRSGMTSALLFFPAVLTGYLIQVVTHTGWLEALVVAHLGTGLVYTAGLVAHRIIVRRRGAKPRARPGGLSPRAESPGARGEAGTPLEGGTPREKSGVRP